MTSAWDGVSNPEDLFNDRSTTLREFQSLHSNDITEISGAITPNARTVIAALVRVYGNDTAVVKDALEVLAPGAAGVIDPDEMSFEGLFVDLISVARYGTNTAGMRARPTELYSSGGSVHYGSTPGAQMAFWLARPQLFKLNVIVADDYVSACEIVDTAIRANRGDIGREVSVAFQGNPLDGYYVWEGMKAVGGSDALKCTVNAARYRLTSVALVIDERWKDLPSKTVVSFVEGVYPIDTQLEVQVASADTGPWSDLYSDNVQRMILNNVELYLRGTDLGFGQGFAYVSTTYNLFGLIDRCDLPSLSGYLAISQW